MEENIISFELAIYFNRFLKYSRNTLKEYYLDGSCHYSTHNINKNNTFPAPDINEAVNWLWENNIAFVSYRVVEENKCSPILTIPGRKIFISKYYFPTPQEALKYMINKQLINIFINQGIWSE